MPPNGYESSIAYKWDNPYAMMALKATLAAVQTMGGADLAVFLSAVCCGLT